MSEKTETPDTSASAELVLSDDPAEVSTTANAVGLFNPDLDFVKLAQTATFVSRGFRLVEKGDLEGVPFVVVNATFRDGYITDKIQGDYVSLECVVAVKDVLNSAQVKAQTGGREISVYPNEAVIINDGGTGIRREMVELLHNSGAINVGGDANDPRRFDRPASMWADGKDAAYAGFSLLPTGEKFTYFAMRGTRRSEYDSPYGPAVTWYFG